MNYIGSKNKLSSFVISTIKETVGRLDDKVFAEIFSGTSIISHSLKNQVKKIITNDLEYYSYVLAKNYIGNNQQFDYFSLFDFLENNILQEDRRFIFNEYSENGSSNRLYFSEYNGKLIDRIRQNIQFLYEKREISEALFFFCLASLLESADKHANTASVYGAYLKKLKRTALKEMRLEPALFNIGTAETEIYNQDSNDLITQISGDILYLDPPYNARQYGANYHLLNTIALYDDFIPKGKTGLREYTKSNYCQKGVVKKVFEHLIENAEFKYIFISYNNEGLMTFSDIKEICSRYGHYDFVGQEYQRFKADSNRQYSDDKTLEYLHILEKN
ncbi:DNA adenine methylase [Mannheimia sp. AT1]|uniref:site-specific DNA-methyltransferase (adenine-specific) n=1 Tax=Mannheimia cairinae TaxID=3025936 RepID=A0ABT5MUD4_9PAST|nr:DNA adenine methylase [Mannheimia cairinae]MDD0825613.1 DNA adenine methylase [Mannheimia cairinae]